MDAVKQLTIADAGGTVSLKAGQTVSLTLKDPASGGFRLNDPQYDGDVLALTGHTHESPADSKPGNTGNDTWSFTAKTTGQTKLEITARRANPGAKDISLFSNEIKVG